MRVAIAGSSGSIGTQTLDVVRAEPDRYEVVGLGVGLVGRRPRRPGPRVPAQGGGRRRSGPAGRGGRRPARSPRSSPTWPAWPPTPTSSSTASSGFAGLPVTIATLRAGKRLALANKESLIAAGPVVQPLRATPGAELVPVDSEHCAVHQCLRASAGAGPRAVAASCSPPAAARSGAGRAAELAGVTVDEALAHPTWSMGPKITVDSSTLMNKGLEVIEAHELFGVAYDQIEVVVHPQSIVHSMVEFTDGATIAQLSLPDMRLPIGYALAYPEPASARRSAASTGPTLRRLDFEPPDLDTFRCLGAGLRGRPGRRHGAGVAQRRQRGGRGGVPRRTDPLDRRSLTFSTPSLPGMMGRWPTSVDAVIDADRRARAVAAAASLESSRTTDDGPAGTLDAVAAADPDGRRARPDAERPRAATTSAGSSSSSRCSWPSASSYSWWAVVLVVGVLLMIFLHELGHFLAARRAGMKVTEFFLGFGPRIWSVPAGRDRVRPQGHPRSAPTCASSG